MAVYVEWRHDEDPVDRPVALFVDSPGGPVDRIAADPDVTTFLNDRFHPVFRAHSDGLPEGSVSFYTPEGCPLTSAARPTSPAAWIELANSVIVRPEARTGHSDALRLTCAAR